VQVSSTTTSSEATYTQQEVDRVVQQALLKEKSAQQPQVDVVEKSPKPKKSRNSTAAELAKSRRPLSKAEREQLAADLRLLSTDDDDESLNLIGDQINQ
ncbi:MAG TPA: hypothetical protein VF435_13505, partial [Pyrinomonadaceae bacterium]